MAVHQAPFAIMIWSGLCCSLLQQLLSAKALPTTFWFLVRWITGLHLRHWAPDQGFLVKLQPHFMMSYRFPVPETLLVSLQERVTAEVSPCEGTSAVKRFPLTCLFNKLSRSSSLSPVSSLLTLPHLGNPSRSTFQRAASPANLSPPISCMTWGTTVWRDTTL